MPANVSIGTPTASTTAATAAAAGNIILSIRDQIPDVISDPSLDGPAFTFNALIRWINDAMRIMATSAPIVLDWGGVQSASGMDLYTLPNQALSVEQAWYDLWPLQRNPEGFDLGLTKITSRAYFFGPHTISAIPILHIWPAADRTGSTTTLSATIAATDVSFGVASAAGLRTYGFIQIDTEVLVYRSLAGTTVSNLLRGQMGTVAAAHTSGAPITELNIMFKFSRLPVPIQGVNDPVEIPRGLWPVLELYVLSKVRDAEQEQQQALALRQEFDKAVQRLGSSAQIRGLRQGIQVSEAPRLPWLYNGRTYVP